VRASESPQLSVADEKTCLVVLFNSLAGIGISPSSRFGLAIFSFPLCSMCNNSDFFLLGPLEIRGKWATPPPADGELMARHIDHALLTFPFSL